MSIDISEIGAVNLTLDFDQDFYEEYLGDNGLEDTPQARLEYIKSDCSFDVEYLDSETYHSMGEYDSMTYDELVENFGQKLADAALRECVDGREHSYEILEYQDDVLDVNNPDELNAVAVKYLRHGGYFRGCRGFILTNGVIVYTESEHNQCSKIPGVKGTFDFIRLGNIRVLPNGLDIAKKPTEEQFNVISQVLRAYSGQQFYLDLMNDRIGSAGRQYRNCEPYEVMQDIRNYFSKGIKPRNGLYEKKIVKISERQLRNIISESLKQVLNK